MEDNQYASIQLKTLPSSSSIGVYQDVVTAHSINQSHSLPPTNSSTSTSVWKKSMDVGRVFHTVLQLLILAILVAILGMAGIILAQTGEDGCTNDATSSAGALTSGNSSLNFTEWADGVAQNVFQLLNSNRQSSPNCTEWADGVAQNVFQLLNSNRQSSPNFTEWADGVAQNVFQSSNLYSIRKSFNFSTQHSLLLGKWITLTV